MANEDEDQRRIHVKVPLLSVEEKSSTSEERPLTKELCDQVFGNHLILDTILDFVVHEDTSRISFVDAKVCRQVQRSWFESVNNALAKRGNVLLKFYLKKVTVHTFQSSMFCQFIKSSKSIFPGGKHITPFRLHFEASEDGLKETLELFVNVIRCGKTGLVTLFLQLPLKSKDCDNEIDCQDLQIRLPALKKFSLFLGQPIGTKPYVNYMPLVQLILSSSNLLNCFELESLCYVDESSFPAVVNLIFPATLTKLNVGVKLQSLETLIINNKLLKLIGLSLCIPTPWNDVVDLALNTFSNTLKYVDLDYLEIGKTHLIPLPQMKNLKTFTSRGVSLKPSRFNLEVVLPKIKKIEMWDATEATFHSWTKKSRFELMEELIVRFEHSGSRVLNELDVITLENSQRLSCTFRKLTKLTLDAQVQCEEGVSRALQHLFMSLSQLQSLNIILEFSRRPRSFFLDSLLLGVTAGFVDALESNSATWNDVELIHEKMLSVVKLTDLQNLAVRFDFPCSISHPEPLSDVVFKFALFKMSKLKNLDLSGIKASYKMSKVWRQYGRCIW